MAQLKCSSWDYEHHPKSVKFVTDRCEILLKYLYDDSNFFDQFGYSTLAAHKFMFRAMTPKKCRYLAGNYRGTIGCLKEYDVNAGGDSRVGYPAIMVTVSMKIFEERLVKSIASYQILMESKMAQENPALKLVHFATMLSDFLVSFLSIHPYANGNGHMARLGVWVLLCRFGFWPKSWPLEQRPTYVQQITAYRNGDTKPLIKFMLQCIGPQ